MRRSAQAISLLSDARDRQPPRPRRARIPSVELSWLFPFECFIVAFLFGGVANCDCERLLI